MIGSFDRLILPTSDIDSMRDAMFTVSPQMSYCHFFMPTIPATTGPVCTPIRISKWTSSFWVINSFCTKALIALAACITSMACVLFSIGSPPAHMYASPMVLIFSRPNFVIIVSKLFEVKVDTLHQLFGFYLFC